MKRKLKHKQLRNPGFFVIVIGIIIISLLMANVLNFDDLTKKNYSGLKDKYPVITDKDIYNFMNYTLFDASNIKTDSLEFIKLNCFSLKHSSALKSFINSANDSLLNQEDKKSMMQQLSDKIYLWDNKAFINVWCLTPQDFAKINRSGSKDYWVKFRKKYGKNGRHRYSVPVFNKDKTKCVIEHSGQGDLLLGSGKILLYKKINGKWVLLNEKIVWIS